MNNSNTQLPSGFRKGWSLSFAVTTGLVLLAASPPFVSAGMRELVMELFSGVCHQLEGRSPHFNNISLGVCHRCFGTYLGLPAAVIVFGSVRGAWPFNSKTAPLFLLMMVIPAIVDWGGDVVGFWQNNPTSRLITGAIMGLGVGYFLAAAMVDWCTESITKKSKPPSRNE